MTGSNITNFLEQGLAADRPAAPNAQDDTLSFYFASDTEVLSYYDWNDGAWQSIGTGLGTVTSAGVTSTSLSVGGSPITTAGNITVNLPSVGNLTFLGTAGGGSATASAITLVAGTNVTLTPGTGNVTIAAAGSGNVSGPGSSTDRGIATWNSTGGVLLRDNSATITSGGNITANNIGNITPTNLSGNASQFLDGSGNWTVPSGSGNVSGPGSSTDRGIVTWNSTGGVLVRNNSATITAGGNITAGNIGNITATNLNGNTSQYLRGDGNWTVPASPGTINFVLDGGGSALTTGVKLDLGPWDFDLTLSAVTMLADQTGSLVLDFWVDTYANYPPTVADTITASAKPTISSAVKSQDTTLTGWTTPIAAGKTLRVNIDSITTLTRCGVALKYLRTS